MLSNNAVVALYSLTVAGGTSAKTATYLTSATVLAGTAPTSVGAINAFFTSITAITLTPGNYFIATAAGASGEGFSGAASTSFLANTSFVNGWFSGSTFAGVGTNINLTNQVGNTSWFTATFDTAPAAAPIPEPATLAVFGAGLAAIAARRWQLAKR